MVPALDLIAVEAGEKVTLLQCDLQVGFLHQTEEGMKPGCHILCGATDMGLEGLFDGQMRKKQSVWCVVRTHNSAVREKTVRGFGGKTVRQFDGSG